MADTHIHALPAGFEFEGYRIERMLGSGGFGITYKATETLIRRSVAIKEYLPSSVAAREINSSSVRPLGEADAELFRWGLKRFRNEARTLVAFHHPNIVSVYRFFEANGTAYLVMAFEEGMSLGAILKQAKTLPESEIHEFLNPLLDGVAEVHKAGFLHRDIKPANIMIRRDGTPSLIDFGAARLALGEKTESASKAVVSPGYAPFEQYASTIEQGPYTDIYALGATVYCCIAGERPPEALDRVAGQSMPTALNTGRGNYSEALLRAVDHALAIKPEERPQTVAAWRAEIADGAADAGAPVEVGGPEPSRTEPMRGPSAQQATAPWPQSARQSTAAQRTARTSVTGPPRRPRRRRILILAAVAIAALAGSAAAYQGVKWYIGYQEKQEQIRREQREREERERRERQEREERERRNAQKRGPAEAAALKAREAQRTAQANYRLALAAKQKGIEAADCGRKAAERGRKNESGYYSGKLRSGNQYDGGLNSQQRPEGCGVLVDTSGSRWEGNFKDGTVHGYVVSINADGKRFEGGYQNGNAHGYGVLRLSTGVEAFGAFRDSWFVGPGVWTEPSGIRYEGQFSDKGRWSGHGVWQHVDGRIYEGEFDDGLMHGVGVMTAKDGTKTYLRYEKGVQKPE